MFSHYVNPHAPDILAGSKLLSSLRCDQQHKRHVKNALRLYRARLVRKSETWRLVLDLSDYRVYRDLAINSELPTADNYWRIDLRCLNDTLAGNRISVPERPQVYKKPHGLLLFVKKRAQPVDCFRCTVAVANRPTRSLACSLDIRGILLQPAQADTSVDDDARGGFD